MITSTILRRYAGSAFLLACTGALLSYSTSLQANQSGDDKPLAALAVEIPEDFKAVSPKVEAPEKELTDAYLEAYIQGVLDTRYPDMGVRVTVRNGSILLSHLSSDNEKNESVSRFVKALTKKNVSNVTRAEKLREKKRDIEQGKQPKDEPTLKSQGIWLPQSTILYPTEVANPRQISFSIGARLNDKLGGRWATPVSFGDQLPIYRWTNIRGGDLQLELEAGVFGLFNMNKKKSYPLINADYYVGVPITFAKGKWAFRLRGYHVSSHIGDEWLIEHKKLRKKRKNKSFEAADFSASYNITPKLRVYGTLGSVIFSDKEMHMKPLYLAYGVEVRGPRTDFTQLFGQPFLAMHFQNVQDVNFALDSTFAVGYELGKIQGVGRKVRLFLEYHKGFSPDGQFSRWRTKYIALRLSYGF